MKKILLEALVPSLLARPLLLVAIHGPGEPVTFASKESFRVSVYLIFELCIGLV